MLDKGRQVDVDMPSHANRIKRTLKPTTATPRPRPSSKECAVSAATLLDRVPPVSPDPDQLALPLHWEVAPGIPSVPPTPRHLRLVGSAPEHPAGEPLPKAPEAVWVARMARAVAEVAAGDRPATQLSRWVERGQLAMLAARGVAFRRHPASAHGRNARSAIRATQHVRAIRICPVAPGVVETSAVLVGDGRGRAIAMRFEVSGSDWLVTAVALG